jgi:hypothetical protein
MERMEKSAFAEYFRNRTKQFVVDNLNLLDHYPKRKKQK